MQSQYLCTKPKSPFGALPGVSSVSQSIYRPSEEFPNNMYNVYSSANLDETVSDLQDEGCTEPKLEKRSIGIHVHVLPAIEEAPKKSSLRIMNYPAPIKKRYSKNEVLRRATSEPPSPVGMQTKVSHPPRFFNTCKASSILPELPLRLLPQPNQYFHQPAPHVPTIQSSYGEHPSYFQQQQQPFIAPQTSNVLASSPFKSSAPIWFQKLKNSDQDADNVKNLYPGFFQSPKLSISNSESFGIGDFRPYTMQDFKRLKQSDCVRRLPSGFSGRDGPDWEAKVCCALRMLSIFFRFLC